jgi:hypothetical protein
MPESDKAAVAELLKPLMLLWASRTERKAAQQAGKLRFWKDGMLKELKGVADGKATAKTLQKLKAKLRHSEEDVSAAIVVLKKIRNRLGGGTVARAIDDVLNNEHFGKGSIRHAIHEFTEGGMTASERKFVAGEICRDIEALNASLDRLQRLVYE